MGDDHVEGDDKVVRGGLVMRPPVGEEDGALRDDCGVDRRGFVKAAGGPKEGGPGGGAIIQDLGRR